MTNTTSGLTTNAGAHPSASAPLTVTAVIPTLAKSIAPASIAPGGTATLTITLGNTNAAPLSILRSVHGHDAGRRYDDHPATPERAPAWS